MSVDSIFSAIKRLNNEASTLRIKLANKRKEEANARDKAMKAISVAQNTKMDSVRKSKLTEYERETKKSVTLAKEIADFEKRLSEKENSLFKEQEKLHKAQEEATAKRLKEDDRIRRQTDFKLQLLSSSVRTVQHEQSKINQAFPLLDVRLDESYDVFISHASDDKATYVDGLVDALTTRGIKVWYDKNQIAWGNSIRQSIDDGLKKSKYAIIVLSEHYMRKYWTSREFNAIFAKESIYGQTILPIWHNITKDQVISYSPMLLDINALNSAVLTVDEIAEAFASKLNYATNG
nr:TIR domain-containing protein [Bacteroides sp.]